MNAVLFLLVAGQIAGHATWRWQKTGAGQIGMASSVLWDDRAPRIIHLGDAGFIPPAGHARPLATLLCLPHLNEGSQATVC